MYCWPLRNSIPIYLLFAALFACKKEKPLPAPAGLAVTNISDTGATIHWNGVNSAKSYSLYLDSSAKPSFSSRNYELEPGVTLVSLTDLTPATTYHIKLVAIGNSGEGTPASVDFITQDADGVVIAGSCDNGIYGFNARDGSLAWKYFTGDQVLATPIIHDSVVYVGSTDGKLYALNASNGGYMWVSGKMPSAIGIVAPVTYSHGSLYFGDYAGWVYRVDASNGAIVWRYILPSPYKNIDQAPVMAGDSTFYLGSYDGRIYYFNVNTGVPIWWTASTGNPFTPGITLYNHTIYASSSPNFYAFDANTGSTKWSGPFFGTFNLSPRISNSNVLIGAGGSNVFAFDATTYTATWSRQFQGVASTPVVADNVVYFGGIDGVHALDLATGNSVWDNASLTSKNIYSGPVVTDKYVYVGTLEGTMYCLDRATGATKWSNIFSGRRFQSSPVVLKYSGKTYNPGVTIGLE